MSKPENCNRNSSTGIRDGDSTDSRHGLAARKCHSDT